MHGNGVFCSRRHSERNSMRIAIIKYGHRKVTTRKAVAWAGKAGDPNPLIINNHISSLMAGETKGDNSSYEFSAYRIACGLLEGDGPFLIVNDTLFHNHIASVWLRMIRKLKVAGPAVVGDPRSEKISFPEKGAFFLASWIYYLPDRESLRLFTNALDKAFIRAAAPEGDEYARYVDHWLKGNRIYGGWHGKSDDEAYARKKRVIRLEHALSLELDKDNLIRSMAGFAPEYALVRLVERIYTRSLALLTRFRI